MTGKWFAALLFGVVVDGRRRHGARRRSQTLRTRKGSDPLSRSGWKDDQNWPGWRHPAVYFRDPESPDHIIGTDADLGRAVFKCIGVPVEFVSALWSGLLPAVAGGRIDVMWADLYYTRNARRMVDFVLYSTMADRALTHKGNPKKIHSLDDLCGVRAIAGLATVEIALLQDLTAKCVAAGKPAIELTTYTDRSQALQMLETERVDIMLSNAAIADAIALEKPLLEPGFSFLPDIKVGVAGGQGPNRTGAGLSRTVSRR